MFCSMYGLDLAVFHDSESIFVMVMMVFNWKKFVVVRRYFFLLLLEVMK